MVDMSSAAAPIFDALHDPTRRSILEALRPGEQSVRELTEQSDVSQPAVSQHLKVLLDADLVRVRPAGRRRLYSVNADGLAPVRAWVDSFWDEALDAFTQHANDRAAT